MHLTALMLVKQVIKSTKKVLNQTTMNFSIAMIATTRIVRKQSPLKK